MNVAAIDIGTNSMRLLVLSDRGIETHRQVAVTGLGVGVDATGHFDDDRVAETLAVLSEFGSVIASLDVQTVEAVATSATRDASNGQQFTKLAAERIGVTPLIIDGEREANLAFMGSTFGLASGSYLVIDIGGGSTEFVRGISAPEVAVSIDIGSVRLTDRFLRPSPASHTKRAEAVAMVGDLFSNVPHADGATVLGVAGTFSSLAAMANDIEVYDRDAVDGSTLSVSRIDELIEMLGTMSVGEIALIPSLHPKRAPVILAGAVIAAGALRAVGAEQVVVRESGLLDGLARELVDRLG